MKILSFVIPSLIILTSYFIDIFHHKDIYAGIKEVTQAYLPNIHLFNLYSFIIAFLVIVFFLLALLSSVLSIDNLLLNLIKIYRIVFVAYFAIFFNFILFLIVALLLVVIQLSGFDLGIEDKNIKKYVLIFSSYSFFGSIYLYGIRELPIPKYEGIYELAHKFRFRKKSKSLLH